MRTIVKRLCFIVTLGILPLLACKGKTSMYETETAPYSDITKLKTISERKIFFGHQSVGFNIIDGTQLMLQTVPEIHINIKETSYQTDFSGAILGHARIGKNGDPKSKVDDFRKKLESGIADSVEIALMKFCFIDFSPQTDVDDIFNYYRSNLEELASKYPNVTFIHCTVPLESGNTGLKGLIKTLLGKRANILANARRNMYNNLIRSAYGDAVFDIAAAECRKSDGSVAMSGGVPCLINTYTDDGSHLNSTGKIIVATELLKIISNTGNTQSHNK